MQIQDTVQWRKLDDKTLAFYKAIGVDLLQVDLRASVSGVDQAIDLRDKRDRTDDFMRVRDQVERHGLGLNAVALSCWDEITLGKPDADEKIDAWCRLLESLGRAGIPHLAWNFKPMGNFRTTPAVGRGGARYSTFDYNEFNQNRPAPYQPGVSEEDMWERMERFLQRVIPVAEEAGVRMALHPDDPPLPEPLGGVAQICSTPEQFRRIFFQIAPSPNNAMLFCQGCMTEALGEGVYDFIAEMASKGKIAYVHFRNVRGQLPAHFEEVFIDEGDINMNRALAIYRDSGFQGPFMMDHTPHIPGVESDWVGKAYAIGYIRAMIQTVYGIDGVFRPIIPNPALG